MHPLCHDEESHALMQFKQSLLLIPLLIPRWHHGKLMEIAVRGMVLNATGILVISKKRQHSFPFSLRNEGKRDTYTWPPAGRGPPRTVPSRTADVSWHRLHQYFLDFYGGEGRGKKLRAHM
ncbi:hypothetical protein OIU85_001001 [Salix viminalis]|uniref:Uncharacterized protein n=1 Tax=Salix viminalis TaxID=40686 RepID=A0A9Q0VKS8_SALVM|nr:hypothetical protein OIU85_001001 [Salix viminalis]